MGRFRVNAYQARGTFGLVFRRVSIGAQSLGELGLPEVVGELSLEPRGLVLVTGPTGSGKTTTLASMVDLVNSYREVNIVTIEDPIEILHSDKKAIVSQREVRQDTADFALALRAAMRQDPDVILVGEMRDQETVRAALSAAETGHLVMSTLHTIDAPETINRIVDFFPPHEQKQIRIALSQSLRGIVSQRLVPKQDGKGRAAAVEIMLNSPLISDLIFKGEVSEIKEIMKKSRNLGMQTFDQALFDMYENNVITYEDALRNADSVNDLRLQIKLNSQRAKTQDLAAGTEHLAIV